MLLSPLISHFSAGCCWTFSTFALVCSSLSTLLLVAPSRLSLSGQLTGCFRAFPATRATGKRHSEPLFDVPSPLILYTWTSFLHRFSAQQKHYLFHSFLPSFLNHLSLHFFILSPQPLTAQHAICPICFSDIHGVTGGCCVSIRSFSSLNSPFFCCCFLKKSSPVQLLAWLRHCLRSTLHVFDCNLPLSATFFYYYYVFLFPLFFSPLFNVLCACSCLGCRHGGQKLWHCVVWMPYFHSTACLELWFVRSLACRGHFLLTVLESLYQNTDWQERRGESEGGY